MGVITGEMLIRFMSAYPEITQFVRRINEIENLQDRTFFSELGIWQILVNTQGIAGERTDREVIGTISRLEYLCQKNLDNKGKMLEL